MSSSLSITSFPTFPFPFYFHPSPLLLPLSSAHPRTLPPGSMLLPLGAFSLLLAVSSGGCFSLYPLSHFGGFRPLLPLPVPLYLPFLASASPPPPLFAYLPSLSPSHALSLRLPPGAGSRSCSCSATPRLVSSLTYYSFPSLPRTFLPALAPAPFTLRRHRICFASLLLFWPPPRRCAPRVRCPRSSIHVLSSSQSVPSSSLVCTRVAALLAPSALIALTLLCLLAFVFSTCPHVGPVPPSPFSFGSPFRCLHPCITFG